MAFASLDYWNQGWVIQRGTDANDIPQPGAPSSQRLHDYIFTRLLDSLTDNGLKFLEWMLAYHWPFGDGASWLRDRSFEEWGRLKCSIDQGQPGRKLRGEASE
jgi:hypothetical protein